MGKHGNENYIHLSNGKNDECYTERYGVEPLLPYMKPYKNKIIWCPFDTEESEFVKVFEEYGYNVVYSHIRNGQDFFRYEPEKWDIIISNPPFTNKKEIFERVLVFNKPFCLLMNVLWFNDSAPYDLFKNTDIQLLVFRDRMQFKRQTQKDKISFKSVYICRDFLPKQIMWADFSAVGQIDLFNGAKL